MKIVKTYWDRVIEWYATHERWRMVAPAFVSLLLLTPNLGETYLWTDEADTAAIARNILNAGYPVMYDGRNLIQYYPPVYNDQYIQVLLPWLPYYITAASFGMFGISTASARLPFVVIGIASILMFPAVVRRLTDDSWTRMVSPLALATFVPFLLYFRQCRYYAVMVFATLWMVWAYLRLVESDERRTWNAVHLVLAATVLFHSHYLVCFGTMVGLGLHWLAAYRTRIPWRTITGIGFGFAILTVPWVIYAQMTIASVLTSRYIIEIDAWSLLYRTIHFWGRLFTKFGEDFSPPLLLIFFIWLLVDRRHGWWRILGCVGCACAIGTVLYLPGTIYGVGICIGLALLALGIRILTGRILITPFSLTWMLPCSLIVTLSVLSYSDEIRYLPGVVPFAFLGLMGVFSTLRLRFPRLSVVLLLIFLYTNVFRVVPAYALSLIPTSAMQIGETLAESYWSYRLGIPRLLPDERNWYHRMVVIDEAIKQRAVIQSYPYEYLYELTHEYDGPIEGVVRYLKQHGTSQDTVKIDSDAVLLIFYMDMIILPEHLFQQKAVQADWVILRHSNWRGIPDTFMDYVHRHYDRIELPYPDMPWENRPEMLMHHFRPPQQDWPPVVVYRRRD